MHITPQRTLSALLADNPVHATVVINRQFTPDQREVFTALTEEYPEADAVIEDWSPYLTKLRLFTRDQTGAPVVFLFDTEALFEVIGS